MRLFVLPISTRQNLIYCQRIKQQLSQQQSYVDKITSKASSTWLGWEKADKGWQKWVTANGNKLFRRIPHEEWGLKSIPPLGAQTKELAVKEKRKIEVVFPRSLVTGESISNILKELGSRPQGYHRKWLWFSVIGMPFTIPVGLIPILPNLPFFYLIFRAWSHWRALSGSRHLGFLVQNRLLHLSPSPTLDDLYQQHHTLNTESLTKVTVTAAHLPNSEFVPGQDLYPETMLLTQSNGKAIAQSLKIPELEAEMERAIEQVGTAISSQKRLEDEQRRTNVAKKGYPDELNKRPVETSKVTKDDTSKEPN